MTLLSSVYTPDELLKLWGGAQANKESMMVLARRLGMPYASLYTQLYRAKRKTPDHSKLFDYNLGQPWQLEGDWMIVGDVHVPYTDYDFASLVAPIARKHLRPPRRLLVGGDLFSMDMFSRWNDVITGPTWEQEREAARALIGEWLDAFDEIRVIMGNHDRRMQIFTAGAFDEKDILALVNSNKDRVTMSPFGYCTITSGGVVWRVTHPANYGLNQLTVLDQLAQKFDSHIIGFHEHHLAIGQDKFKRHVIVNGGCLVDPAKLAYVTLDDTKSAGMANGFVMLRNGTPTVFGRAPFTDWEAVL